MPDLMTSNCTVIVLGGGFAGIACAQHLYRLLPTESRILLVDQKDHYLHLIGCARAAVTPEVSYAEKVLIPTTNVFDRPEARAKQKQKKSRPTAATVLGKAIKVDNEKKVVTVQKADETTEDLKYTYLVCATGTKWANLFDLPNSRDDSITMLHGFQKNIAAAKKLLVVGGGAVGIEVAAEIKYFFPEKHVVLVHKHDLLLQPIYPKKFREDITQRLSDLGVELILQHMVVNPKELADELTLKGQVTATTHKKKAIEGVELIIGGMGEWSRNTSYLPPNVLTPKTKCLMIRDTFQVDVSGWDNVFGIGDIAHIEGEVKQAFKYGEHAKVCAENILKLHLKKPLKVYKKQQNSIVVSVGPENGAGYMYLLGGVMLGGFLSRNLKSKDLLVSQTQAQLQIKPAEYMNASSKSVSSETSAQV